MRAATFFAFVVLASSLGVCANLLTPAVRATNAQTSTGANRRLLQEPASLADAEPTLAEAYFNQTGATPDDVHAWFEEADVNGNDLVSLKELEAWINRQGFTVLSGFDILFDSYDQDNDGRLSQAEFGQLMNALTEPLPPMNKVLSIISYAFVGLLMLLGCCGWCCKGLRGPSFSISRSPAPVHLAAPHGATAAAPVHTAVVCLPGSGSSDLEKVAQAVSQAATADAGESQ